MTLSSFFDPPRPRLFAHRGSSAGFPENTLASFQAALHSGIVYLELDVRMTRDGHVVVHHDDSALRTCGVDRRIQDLTLAEIRELDAGFGFSRDNATTYPFRGQGTGIPTLEEVLKTFPGAYCNIEVKQECRGFEKRLLGVLRETRSEDRVLLAAMNDAIMDSLRKTIRGVPTSLSQGELAGFLRWVAHGASADYEPPGDAIQVPTQYDGVVLIRPETIRAAHASGMEVHAWTINDPREMMRLFRMGVDGLMSDYPDRLLQAARRQ